MAGQRVLYIPAGRCPVKLDGTSLEEVTDWSNRVVEHGKQNNLVYLPSALVYFAQQFYNIFTEEYKVVKNNIEQIFNFNNISLENEQIKQSEARLNFINEEKEKNKAKESSELREVDNDGQTISVPIKKKRGRPPKKQ